MANNKQQKAKEKQYNRLVNFYCGNKSYKKWYLFLVAVCFAAVAYFFLKVQEQSQFTLIAHYVSGGLTALFVLLFILALFGVFKRVPSHKMVEQWMKEDHDVAYKQLFEALSIEKNPENFIETPIEFAAPQVYPGRGRTLFHFKKDSIVYSQSNYHWILFGKDTLFHYSASVNHLDRIIGYEVAEEFLYTDIVTIKTQTKRINEGSKSFEVMELVFTLINGQSVEIIVRNIESKDDATRPLTEVEKYALQTIRRVIREHK